MDEILSDQDNIILFPVGQRLTWLGMNALNVDQDVELYAPLLSQLYAAALA